MDGNLVRQLCDFDTDNQDKNYTYHPSSSGLVERYNWTILQTIRCFRKSKQQDWDLWLSKLARANIATPNMQTDLPRTMMMFGREAFQPVYVTLGTLKIDPPKKEVSQYIKDLVDNFVKIHETAKEILKAKQEEQNGLHYLKNYHNSYTVEDAAYKRNQSSRGGQSAKLQPPVKVFIS